MAGTGKSEILQEAQRILSPKNEAFRQFITACPTHKACKVVNGITVHRLFGVNPLDYSYEYKKVAELKGKGIKYIFVTAIVRICHEQACHRHRVDDMRKLVWVKGVHLRALRL